MDIKTKFIECSTKGFSDIVDISKDVQHVLDCLNFIEGSVSLFVIGSTAAVTTLEYEPGLLRDVPELYEKFAPYNAEYLHHQTWGDDNGAAHLRASLTGSSLSLAFMDKKLILGTWQQIVLIDFDTSPRTRKIVVQIIGKEG